MAINAREAELERTRLNKELADLWGEMNKVKEAMMAITKQGVEANWTKAVYEKARGALNDQRAAIATKIQSRMAELKVAETVLGLR